MSSSKLLVISFGYTRKEAINNSKNRLEKWKEEDNTIIYNIESSSYIVNYIDLLDIYVIEMEVMFTFKYS